MGEPGSETDYKEMTEEAAVLSPEEVLPPEAAAQTKAAARAADWKAARAAAAAVAAEQKKKTRPPKDTAETKKMDLITKILTEFSNFTGDALYSDYRGTRKNRFYGNLDLKKLDLEELEEFQTIMNNVKGIFANIIEPALRERFTELMKKADYTIDDSFFSNENLIEEILTGYSAFKGKDLYNDYTGTDLKNLDFIELESFQKIMNSVKGNFAAIKIQASREKFTELMKKANHTIGDNFFKNKDSEGGKRRTKRRHRKGTKKSKRSKKKSKKSKKRSKRRH